MPKAFRDRHMAEDGAWGLYEDSRTLLLTKLSMPCHFRIAKRQYSRAQSSAHATVHAAQRDEQRLLLLKSVSERGPTWETRVSSMWCQMPLGPRTKQ